MDVSTGDPEERKPERVVLLGGGGHASDVLGAIEFINSRSPTWAVIGVADDSPEPRLDRFENRGVRFLGTIDEAIASCPKDVRFLATVGFPEGRRAVAERAERAGLRAATLIDPRATIETHARIGEGAVIMEGVHVSPLCRVGRHVYLSHKVMIGHDVQVGDFTSILPLSAIGGDSIIEEDVLICLSASIINRKRVGRGAVVGAGAVVVRDVEAGTTVLGVPAKPREKD